MSTDHRTNDSYEREGKRAPVRYFDYPLFTDPWFLFGLVLFGTTIALSIWLVASSDLLGFVISVTPNLTSEEILPFAREALAIALVIVVIAWVLPPTIRLWKRKQRLLEHVPDDGTPGFLPDPVYRECDRYWTGTQWSQYVKPQRKISWAKNLGFILVGASAFVAIQLIGAQPQIKSLNTYGAYFKADEVYSQYIDDLPADVEAQPWDEYAAIHVAVSPKFTDAAQNLEVALSEINREDLDGVSISAMNDYSFAYSRWASELNQVAQEFEQCSLSNEQCLIDAYDPLAEQFALAWENLVIESDTLNALMADIW
jgi:hypothetical protein